mgnify:CR=1 FL=1
MGNLMNYYGVVVDRWYGGSSRKFIEYAISRMGCEWSDKSIFIVEAPTGYGKSAISATMSLYSVFEEFKSIIAFPLRVLLEDQYDKFRKIIPEYMLGKRYMHTHESPYLIHPVTLTTIDTLSLTVFGISPEDLNKVAKRYLGTSIGSFGHYWFSWASVALSNMVLDEAHLVADSTKSLNFLLALMDFVIRHDSKLILMSATLPKALKEKLINELGYPEKVSTIEFTKDQEGYDEEFVKERRRKKYDVHIEPLRGEEKFDKIAHWILKNNDSFDRVIVVFNTVEDAITFYEKIKNMKEFEGYFNVVLHSRFSDIDRKEKVSLLRKIRDMKKYIVVSTQTIEAGVDISSTLFITEIAPANSLIQRLGRFLRYGESEGEVYIWYEVGSDGKLLSWNTNGIKTYKVYDFTLTEKTLKFLKCRGKLNFHVPEDYSELLDNVYGQEDFRINKGQVRSCLLYTSPSPRDLSTSRMPSSA